MKKLMGLDIARAIESLASEQTAKAQEDRAQITLHVVNAFASKNNLPTQPSIVSTVSRIARQLDPSGLRTLRSLSDDLLRKSEAELLVELKAMKSELAPVDAQTHQVKTRSAFITTVLRPFNAKFTSLWFLERNDFNESLIKSTIERLEREVIETPTEISTWSRDVIELFEVLVVYRGQESDNYYSRPSGTVSPKSSRTYVQSWLAYVEKFREEIWDKALVFQDAPNQKLRQNRDVGSNSRSALTNNSDIRESAEQDANLVMSFATLPNDKSLKKPKFVSSKKTESAGPLTIQIYIESTKESSAQATRKWANFEDFADSIQKWLGTFPILWGSAADEFLAKVTVKNSTGESDLTLPRLVPEDAAERLLKAVEMQQH